MKILFWSIYIILSLFIGSFLNVVGLRIPKKESIVYPPSHCPSCDHRLKSLDLVPIFSYLFLKGKCRYCGRRISPIYPFGEFITFIALLLIPIVQPINLELIIAYLFTIILIIATISDLRYKIIPDQITYPTIIIFFVLRFWIHFLPTWHYLLGGLIGGGLLFLLSAASKGGMGGGDIKLFTLIGLVLGWQNTILALFISSLIGSIVGFSLMIIGKVKRKQFIPYGPFIAMGAYIAYFFGNEIWSWYLSLAF